MKNGPNINQKSIKNGPKIDQKSSKIEHTKYSCRRPAKDIQNPPADAQPSPPADAQPRIYEILLPTPRARNNEKIRYNGGEATGVSMAGRFSPDP